MNVSPGEKLTRFIRYSNQFSKTNRVVRYRAFSPPRKSVDLSVFRISLPPHIPDSEVWKIGTEIVQQGGSQIKARADLLASDVHENNLEVIPDEPPQRHANITPFPADNKARQGIARRLAVVSQLVLPPEPA